MPVMTADDMKNWWTDMRLIMAGELRAPMK
jgi:hypothetical protein